MNRSRGPDIGSIIVVLWMLASFVGILYSFRFLVSATVMFVIYLAMGPRDRRKRRGYEAMRVVDDWKRGRIPRPSEDVFRAAADWFMFEWAIASRQEDMGGPLGLEVPDEVKPYILSERVLRR